MNSFPQNTTHWPDAGHMLYHRKSPIKQTLTRSKIIADVSSKTLGKPYLNLGQRRAYT